MFANKAFKAYSLLSCPAIRGQVFAYVVTMMSCGAMVSCGGGTGPDDSRSDGETEALRMIDDSLAVNSPYMEEMISDGMAGADDSLEYYDYYLRMLRNSISQDVTDTAKLDWDRPFSYLHNCRKSPRVRGMLAFLYNIKGYYLHKFNYNPYQTINMFHAAYRYLPGSDTEYRMPDVCANLGDAYVTANDMPRAASWYRRALFLADSLQLSAKDNVSLYMGLGRIYLNLGDFDAALECYRNTDRNFNQLQLNMKLYFLNNYGNYYYYAKDYNGALAVFTRLRKLLEDTGMDKSYEMYLCKINMADTYLNLGRSDEARLYLDEAESFFRKIGDEVALYYANTIRMGLALRRNDVDEVRRILGSENIGSTVDFNLVNIRQGYLRDYYVKTGDFRKAYYNLAASVERNDSLKHNTERMRTSEIMMRYSQDTLQLHHQIAMQEKDADIRRARSGLYIGVMLAVILGLLLLFYAIYSQKRKLQMNMQLMNLRLTSARGRISPHFIFNVLNNRISKITDSDADELMSLVHLIRANLNMSDKLYVSLKEELDFVKYYISVEKACIGGDFIFGLAVPPEDVLRRIMIPSMFIQILVENAIKHGLKGREGRKRLNINVMADSSWCRITVTDNGTGFDIRHRNENSTGTGLKVIRSTINIINSTSKRKIRLGIRNVGNGSGGISGCEASLELPVDIAAGKQTEQDTEPADSGK